MGCARSTVAIAARVTTGNLNGTTTYVHPAVSIQIYCTDPRHRSTRL